MEPLYGRTALLVQVAWLLAVSVCSSSTPWERANASGGLSEGISPEDQGLRPGNPLDELPPPDLIEPPNKLLDPKPHDLNATALKAMLGRNFDHHFMSITRPNRHSNQNHSASSGNDLVEFPFRRNRRGRLVPVGEMPRSLRKMNFKYIRLPDGSRLRTRISAKLKKKLQQFLWAFTACPIVYRWKDLGIRFWPRYLKEGHCPPGKTSCSIPPGMTCRPAAKDHKTLLRWHCPQHTHHHHHNSGSTNHHRNLLYSSSSSQSATVDPTVGDNGMLSLSSGGTSHKSHCHWIKVKYPIVTHCSCSCPNNGSSYS
ncbi:noggin-3-like [Periplaneta americana]|uniref:noggin-3-like n=1 Tax=Periplaneta americana TaxID=6978 RepID=UPI0037E8A6FB